MNTFRRPPPPSSFRGSRPFRPFVQEKHRINDRIVAREVRVIGAEGEQLGVLATRDAIAAAEAAGLDLVEVAPTANPPVCRILDYGKFKYKEQKKEAEAKKKRTETGLKEIRIRYQTDIGDIDTKVRQAREFLLEGNKVKFSMRFRAREITHADLGRDKFDLLVEKLSDVATVEDRSPIAGTMLFITFVPGKATPPAK